MSSCREWIAAALLASAAAAAAQGGPYPGVGRPATPKEIAAWDIDVRPDFKGLPKGSGSVAKGQDVWDAKCASCHGVFGESNQVFHPLVGGTGKDDVKTGRVARLADGGYPGRTTLMKAATVSTLWDYINRAMPWTEPKSLSVEEVYGVTAYLLNLGGVLPDDFVLSDANIARVQQLMPNRNGMTRDHALWPGASAAQRKPDVQAAACMKDCGPEPRLASSIPEHALDAHGNLAEQNRPVGAQRGAETGKPKSAPAPAPDAAPKKPGAAIDQPIVAGPTGAIALAQKHACAACHGIDDKLVGPSFREIAGKHADRPGAASYFVGKIKSGASGVWGQVPMPPQSLPEADAQAIAQWLAGGAKKP